MPSNSLKCPRTVAIIMCLASNATLEWAGSAFHVPAGTWIIPRSVWSWVMAGLLVVAVQVPA